MPPPTTRAALARPRAVRRRRPARGRRLVGIPGERPALADHGAIQLDAISEAYR